jgi:hypothetical protein
MEDISLFHNYSKKHLAIIITELIKNDFDFKNPYSDDNNINILEEAVEPFGESISDIDMEFFAKIIKNDKELAIEIANSKLSKSLYERLEIPKIDKYNVNWKESGSCNYIRFFRDTWSSYDENWVEYAIDSANNNGNYAKWEAEYDEDYENFEAYDDTYTSIEKITETKQSGIDKLVIENTSYAIDSLDRKSLIILKSIIDKKLGL